MQTYPWVLDGTVGSLKRFLKLEIDKIGLPATFKQSTAVTGFDIVGTTVLEFRFIGSVEIDSCQNDTNQIDQYSCAH